MQGTSSQQRIRELLEDSREGLSGKPIVHARKDGVRVYYDENREIHREPEKGPAIEAVDGTGPCYIHGRKTGEVYSNEVAQLPTKEEIDAILADPSDNLFDEEIKFNHIQHKRPTKMQLLMEIAQGPTESIFENNIASMALDRMEKRVSVSRVGKTLVIQKSTKKKMNSSMVNILTERVPPETEKDEPADSPLAEAVSKLQSRFKSLHLKKKPDEPGVIA